MRLSFLKQRLFAPLYASAMLLILLLLCQEGLVLAVNLLKQRAVNGVIETFKIKRESERLLGAALEEKVALRGYLLSNDTELLSQYKEGRTKLNSSLDELYRLFETHPEKREKLQEIRDFHAKWEFNFAQPILNNSFNLEDIEDFSSIAPLRKKVNSILTYEKGVLAEQNKLLQQLDRLNQLSIGLSSLSFALLIVGSILNLILLRRRVVAPLQKLIWASHAWKQGQLKIQINHASEDEVGQLSRTLNGMAQEIHLRQREIQQRTEQLEDLISALSHDLRTPLLASRSTLDAIAGGAFGQITPELSEVLAECCEGNHDLIKLVETLLDVSRYEVKGSQILTQERLNWSKICQRVSNWIQNSSQEKCQLQIHIAPDLSPTLGDGIEIQRVLQNLVDNAVRLSPASSTVSINISQPLDGSVEVTVKDQGPGLTEQEVKTVFYRFAQVAGRKGRAGLGLYLCRQIIEAHGGSIWVESIPGQGATFRFSLPVSPLREGNATASIPNLARGM